MSAPTSEAIELAETTMPRLLRTGCELALERAWPLIATSRTRLQSRLLMSSLLRLPLLVKIADEDDRFVGGVDACRNVEVLRTGERQPWVEHTRPGPFDKPPPHLADEDERNLVDVPDLQQLPDHQHFEHGADAAGHHHERVRCDHKMMQAGKEGLVLEGLHHERVDLLLEWQLDADADRACRPSSVRSFVGRLHQARAAASDDVTAERGKGGGGTLHLVVNERAGLRASRSEDRHAIAFVFRGP